jgi:plastocyanin
MTKRMLMVLALLFTVGMTVAACGGSKESTEKEPAGAGAGAQATDAGAATASEKKEYGAAGAEAMKTTVVTKDSFAFEPAELTAKAGQMVEITLDNSGGQLDHSWVLAKKGVDKDTAVAIQKGESANVAFEMEVKPGGKETKSFTAPTEPGEYIVVCHVAGHAAGGMVGKLTVQ